MSEYHRISDQRDRILRSTRDRQRKTSHKNSKLEMIVLIFSRAYAKDHANIRNQHELQITLPYLRF